MMPGQVRVDFSLHGARKPSAVRAGGVVEGAVNRADLELQSYE